MQTYKYFNNKFYAYSLKESYEASENWPDAGVDVDEELHTEFSGIPPIGKIRITGEDGFPLWADIPAPTHEELVSVADDEKQRLIDNANAFINSKQWPGKAAIGRLKTTELAQYNLWLDYLDAIESINTSAAPDINWPEIPA